MIQNSPRTIPYYLITSYLYYERDRNLIKDITYDQLCKHILQNWDKLNHPHKKYLDKELLMAGSGFNLKYPTMAKDSAVYLWNENNPSDILEQEEIDLNI